MPVMSPSSNAQSIAIIKGSKLISVSPVTMRKSLKDLLYFLKAGVLRKKFMRRRKARTTAELLILPAYA